MTNEINQVKTDAWKEIQLTFHNFKVIENLGMLFSTEKSKSKKRFVRVECLLCGKIYSGPYQLFQSRDKVCICESKKGKVHVAWCSPERARILKIRNGIIYRCHNIKCETYVRYGGRGIIVCDEWLNSAENFYKWALENGYNDGLTIERKDNNKGYNPDNCCWITRSEQARNKRNTLKRQQVLEIKEMLKNNIKHKDIASMMGVTLNRIARISCGMSWSNI